jgi:hypothetical protein
MIEKVGLKLADFCRSAVTRDSFRGRKEVEGE